MTASTFFNVQGVQDPTFRVWAGMGNTPKNLYWSGESFFMAVWKLLEARFKKKAFTRLEWS